VSLFFIFCSATLSFSQTLYLEKVSTVSIGTYRYLKTTDNKKMKLDFYRPKKVKGILPLLIYVHAGGFSGGKRNDKNTVRFAKNMATRAYAMAAISYRLTMKKRGFRCDTRSKDKVKAFNAASEDRSTALEYLLKKKISLAPRKMILVSSSAGVEAVLNGAYGHHITK
jgi:para-nitrobenzyl esterase